VLGAGPFKVFRTVFFPAIAPAAISGAIRAFGRAIGEFGAIVLVAGNNPARGTLTAPVYIFGEIESGAPHRAAAVAIVLLLVALSLHAIGRWVETRTRHA
jgi:sulfate transport system permease protein